MVAAVLLSERPVMNASPSTQRPCPKEVLVPVTRLVATLSMTVQNGQLVARPLVLAAGQS
jgi:hypothetical protein